MGLVTVTFDRLTLKVVFESHRTFLPNLGMLGLWVLELFAMYRRTKATLTAPFLRAGA